MPVLYFDNPSHYIINITRLEKVICKDGEKKKFIKLPFQKEERFC